MSQFRPYPTYKDSGMDWLPSVPMHWSDRKIARDIPFVVGWTPSSGKDEYYDGDLPWVTIADLTQMSIEDTKSKISQLAVQDKGAKIVPAGSMLFSFKLSVGKVAFLSADSYTNEAIAGFLPSGPLNLKYWKYAAPEFIPRYGRENIYGATLLNQELISSVRFFAPSMIEQEQIARFLDYKTSHIDALIEEQQRLIELLKEKRKAVISHAVTKGLDQTVTMKDSGVDWLGEVPAHWAQIRMKHILTAMIDAEHKTADYSDEGEYLVCRTTNVRDGRLSLQGAKYADKKTYLDWTRRGKPEPLDILFTREAPAGEACVVPETPEICLGQRMVLFKLDKARVAPDFTVHSIYSGLASDFVKQLSQGSTVSHFNMADIGNIPLFEPPLNEQRSISVFLASCCGAYNSLIEEAELSVALISERRAALISAAVTGKIDVSDWQPPISAKLQELEKEAM